MDEHVAIKCTWQDGGSEGFEEVCSIKIMRLNVMKRVWCSQKDNPCRQFLERGQGGPLPHRPCYESGLFDDGRIGFGVWHTGWKAGLPIRPAATFGDSSVALLTARLPEVEEDDRRVVGIFKLHTEVYQDFEGGTWYVDASPALSFRIPHNAWPKFWT